MWDGDSYSLELLADTGLSATFILGLHRAGAPNLSSPMVKPDRDSDSIPEPQGAVEATGNVPTRFASKFRDLVRILHACPIRKYAIGLIATVAAILLTAVTDFSVFDTGSGTILFWYPSEMILWLIAALAGFLYTFIRQNRVLETRLSEVSKAEEDRRAIAAIGMAASWDLDLNRL